MVTIGKANVVKIPLICIYLIKLDSKYKRFRAVTIVIITVNKHVVLYPVI